MAQTLLYMPAYLSRGENPEAKPGPSMPYNSSMTDVADKVFLPARVLLTSFCDVLQTNGCRSSKRDTSERTTLTPVEIAGATASNSMKTRSSFLSCSRNLR